MTFYLIGLFAATIVFILVASRLAVHPFLALLIAAFAFGIGADMSVAYIIRSIGNGFAGTLEAVGLVVVAGSIIGAFVERSGGGRSLAAMVMRFVGRRRVSTGMTVLGYGLGITASLEAAFVLLMPLNRSAARAAGGLIVAGAVALALGLVATHGMVPPAPGPVTAAAILAADLWLVLLWGMGIAAIAAAAGGFYAVTVARRINGGAGEAVGTLAPAPTPRTDGPDAWRAILPIAVPIALLVVGSVGQYPSEPFGGASVRELLTAAGRPAAVLLAGLVLCLAVPKRLEWPMVSEAGWMGQAIGNVAATVLIVGAGGSFAKVLQNSGVGMSVAELIASANFGLLVPFAIAAAMKTAQGSTMVAIITAAGFTQPLLPGLGLDGETAKALAVVAIGAGAMVVAHANDSLFWIVTRSCGLTPAQGYRLLTLGTLAQGGVAAFALLAIQVVIL